MHSTKSLVLTVLYVAVLEAWIFWIFYSCQRPNKEIREKITFIADAKGISKREARNYILKLFFYMFDHGLKEVMFKPQKSESQLFEEWKAEQDRKFEEDVKKLQEHKQIVKPRKIHPEK